MLSSTIAHILAEHDLITFGIHNCREHDRLAFTVFGCLDLGRTRCYRRIKSVYNIFVLKR